MLRNTAVMHIHDIQLHAYLLTYIHAQSNDSKIK